MVSVLLFWAEAVAPPLTRVVQVKGLMRNNRVIGVYVGA
jgi:hypothetical protein